MREIFVSSDPHWGHANIIRYCDRPFKDVDEMNEIMIQRHNEVVRPQDIWYCLGDVYFGRDGWKYLSRLNGHKRLILGNHDNATDHSLQKHFDKILMWRMFKDLGVLLTHVPVHPSTLDEKAKVHKNVHGHIHQNPSPQSKGIQSYQNVSMEWIDYRPVSLESLRAKK